jgi:hypothetical protein
MPSQTMKVAPSLYSTHFDVLFTRLSHVKMQSTSGRLSLSNQMGIAISASRHGWPDCFEETLESRR